MILVARIVHDISRASAAAGRRYQREGLVCTDRLSTKGFRGHVHGSQVDPYEVALRWPLARRDARVKAACSCPNFFGGYVCKHIWAALYEVDAEKMEIASGRRQLRLERDPTLLPTADLGRNRPAALSNAPPRAARGRRPGTATNPNGRGQPSRPGADRQADALSGAPAAPWIGDLQKIREQSTQRARTAGERPTIRAPVETLWYVIDPEATSDNGAFTVSLVLRRQQRDGTYVTRLVRDVRQVVRSVSDPADRELVALLQGMQPARDRMSFVAPNDLFEYEIDPVLAPEFLPRLLATNRVTIDASDAEIDFDVPLRWDDGAGWSLQLEIATPRGGKMWWLVGALVRGRERMDLDAPLVVLPSGLVTRSGMLARLDERAGAAFEWIELLRDQRQIVVPLRDRERLVEILAAIPGLPPVVWPADFEWQIRDGEPRARIEIIAPGAVNAVNVRATMMLDYEGHRTDPRRDEPAVVDFESRTWLRRNRASELELRAELEAMELPEVSFAAFDPWDLRIPRRNLPAAVRKLRDAGWTVEAEGQLLRHPSGWSFSVTSGIDWFDVDARCAYDGVSVGLPHLLAAVRRRETFVTLGDGSLAMLPEEWLARFAPLAELGETQGDVVRFVRPQIALLDALLAEHEATVQADARFVQLRDQVRRFDGVRPSATPAGFEGELREYQRIGVGWLGFLREFGLGGCLADDMGLGKTIQVLALLEQVRMEAGAGAPHRPSLVVVPRSLVYNWIVEAARFTPRIRVLDYTGLDRQSRRAEIAAADLVVTTYGTLRRDIVPLREIEFEYVILDEAQAIKNSASESAKASRLLRARHRLAVTGTPIENHLGELWSIFEFLNPGMLGRATAFRGVDLESSGGVETGWLARALRPYILRRTKERVLSELPAKTEQTLHCEMDAKQRRLYDEIRAHYRESLGRRIETDGLARSKIHVLEALLRLRQVACHPGLVDPRRAEESSAKLETLLAQLEEVLSEGHKALVFSQFTRMLAIVRRRLDARRVTYEYLDGRTRDRAAKVTRFQEDPACGVFLISLKAGGQGLNLTAADYVFLLDPWWNPAVEAQAIDRTHRIGQTRRVFAYRLLCKGTVEEKIEQLQSRKRDLAAAVLSDDASFLRRLTADDLKMLLE